ncbi:MAG: YchE family NAAT transporter [Bacillota bacterium]
MHGINAWVEYLKFFAGLVAILNPIGVIPIFINLTYNQTARERNRTALMAAVTVGTVLGVALLCGEWILNFFGISVASFQVAGGILILYNSLSMLQAKMNATRQTEEEAQETAEREDVAVVPIGVPLTAGPGAISTVILYGHKPALFGQYVILFGGIAVISAIIWAAFRLAPFISRALSRTGINIVTRLMGLIMAAIGIEFIAAGLRVLFPSLTP